MNKYSHLFHEPMTSKEARNVLFREVTKENKEELLKAYDAYIGPVIDKELQYAHEHPEWILY